MAHFGRQTKARASYYSYFALGLSKTQNKIAQNVTQYYQSESKDQLAIKQQFLLWQLLC